MPVGLSGSLLMFWTVKDVKLPTCKTCTAHGSSAVGGPCVELQPLKFLGSWPQPRYPKEHLEMDMYGIAWETMQDIAQFL